MAVARETADHAQSVSDGDSHRRQAGRPLQSERDRQRLTRRNTIGEARERLQVVSVGTELVAQCPTVDEILPGAFFHEMSGDVHGSAGPRLRQGTKGTEVYMRVVVGRSDAAMAEQISDRLHVSAPVDADESRRYVASGARHSKMEENRTDDRLGKPCP